MPKVTLEFWLKKGDRTPPIIAQATDDDGVPIDLSGATGITFVMRLPSSNTLKVDAAGALHDGPNGKLRYDWASNDTDTPNDYYAEFEYTLSNKQGTVPNDGYIAVHIVDDLRP